MTFLRLIFRSRGITGLETAVVLLAFFVVSSVLGITVVKLGRVTSSDANQTVERQIADTLPVIKPKGLVMGVRTGDEATGRFHLATHLVPVVPYSDEPVQLDPASLIISYYDGKQYADDLPWTARWVRGGGENDFLEPDELAEISVDLSLLEPKLVEYTNFTLELKPIRGGITRIEPTSPGRLDPVSVLSY